MHTSGTGFSGPAYSISLRHPLLSRRIKSKCYPGVRDQSAKRPRVRRVSVLFPQSPVGSGSSAQLMETNQSREDYKRSSMATIRAFVDDLSRETVSGLASTTNTST